MNLSKISIDNFRAIESLTLDVHNYTVCVGANGAGKSTVLCALNLFFGTTSPQIDPQKLSAEDFYMRQTDRPIRVQLTFNYLSPAAIDDMKDYVRNGELVVSTLCNWNGDSVTITQVGSRLVIQDFTPYFEAEKARASAEECLTIYRELKSRFPDLPAAVTKTACIRALREYEEGHPESCVLVESGDAFFGFTRGRGLMERHIQWIYVPAVKDVQEEQQEQKDTAIGRLLAATIRSKVDFSPDVEAVRTTALKSYSAALEAKQHVLAGLASQLQKGLRDWSHPDARLDLRWGQDSQTSVKIQDPIAELTAGEENFLGQVQRLGHGLQRSLLFTLLHTLTEDSSTIGPTLLLGIEEPELYQHPPQVAHIANVLLKLSTQRQQIILTTHNIAFVQPAEIESLRMFRRNATHGVTVNSATAMSVESILADIEGGRGLRTENATISRMIQHFTKEAAAMFFCRGVVFVEGPSDRKYSEHAVEMFGDTAQLRAHGVTFVVAHGKNAFPMLASIAQAFEIPHFVVSDGDRHEKDDSNNQNANARILRAFDGDVSLINAEDHVTSGRALMWHGDIERAVARDLGMNHFEELRNSVRDKYGLDGVDQKNVLFVDFLLTETEDRRISLPCLQFLANAIMTFSAGLSAPKAEAPSRSTVKQVDLAGADGK